MSLLSPPPFLPPQGGGLKKSSLKGGIFIGDSNEICLEYLVRGAHKYSSGTCLLSLPQSLIAPLLAKQTAPLAVKISIIGYFHPRARSSFKSR